MAISKKEESHFLNEKRKIEKTAYIRFDLSERISSDERFSVIFSSTLTIYLICASIALYADNGLAASTDGKAVTVSGIIASVSLLVTNLLDHSERRALRSRDMMSSAQGLLRIASQIGVEIDAENPDPIELRRLLAQYHDAIGGISENHSVWDNTVYETLESMRSSAWCKIPFLLIKYYLLKLQRFLSVWFLHIAVLSICGFSFCLLVSRVIHAIFP